MTATNADRARRGAIAHRNGLAAEDIVAREYSRRGRPIAHRRWRGTGGEIDLIAREGDRVVFVEVKSAANFDKAILSVRQRQIDRIFATAGEFLDGEPGGSLTDIRFDLALVDRSGGLRILENAFA